MGCETVSKQFKGQAGQANAKQLEQILKSVEKQVARAMNRAAKMDVDSDRFQELVEALTAKAEAIQEEASGLAGEDFQRDLTRQIEKIMRRVQEMLQKAEQIEDEADAADDEADTLRDQADELREVLEEIRETETEVASRGR